MSEQELQVRERQDAHTAGESTKDEPCYAPQVDIYETARDVFVLADMPGVTAEGVEISLDDGVLAIQGRREPEAREGRMLLEEYVPGHYLRRFTVAETIDQEGIEATLADGVLKVRLPKAEPAKPRRIEVKAG